MKKPDDRRCSADPKATYHKELFEAICDAFDKCFTALADLDDGDERARHRSGPHLCPAHRRSGPVVAGVGTMPPGGFV